FSAAGAGATATRGLAGRLWLVTIGDSSAGPSSGISGGGFSAASTVAGGITGCANPMTLITGFVAVLLAKHPEVHITHTHNSNNPSHAIPVLPLIRFCFP